MKTFKEFLLEESEKVHHTSVIPLTGFSPISHMGHAKDLGASLSKLPGDKHIGISDKSDLYSAKERSDILDRQFKIKNLNKHIVKSAGETIASAYNKMPKSGKKVLHLLIGHDRKTFGEGLKKSLEDGKIKEMGTNKFHEIHLHYPEDSDRSHGLSGTNMRNAAKDKDLETFHKHLGANFSKEEAKHHMEKIGNAINNGTLKIKR